MSATKWKVDRSKGSRQAGGALSWPNEFGESRSLWSFVSTNELSDALSSLRQAPLPSLAHVPTTHTKQCVLIQEHFIDNYPTCQHDTSM